jgi:crotonobetainyl-CoA:carnitine CoA-transferase CaiB-like acyl-CoA transferase
VTADAQPLSGIVVAELAHQLPLAFAGRELARLGARVVRIEPPEGEALRHTAPA